MSVLTPTSATGAPSQPAGGGTARVTTTAQSGNAAATESLRQAAAPVAQPSLKEVQEAVERIRQAVAPAAQSLQFSVDEELGRTIIRVLDSTTKEVIRQIPSEEVVAVSKALDRLQGLLLKQQA